MTAPTQDLRGCDGRAPPLARSERPARASDAAARGRERARRLTLGSATALASKGIHVGTMLVVVPLTLTHLGAERYGVWMTITSFLMLLTFADFGLGNGLLNAVAAAVGRADVEGARRAVSTVAILLASIAAALAVAFGVTYAHVPWDRVLNTESPELVREGAVAAAVLFYCFVAGLPLAVTQRVQGGHQELHVANLWQAAGSLLTLGGLWCAVAAKASLPVLVATAAGAPVVTAAMSSWYEFGRRRPALRPAWRSFSSGDARLLLGSGGLFVVLQVAAVVLGSSDNLIVSHILGPRAVTSLAVPARLFAVVPLVVALALGPLWPAYAAAKAEGDIRWIRRTMTRSMLVAAGLASLAGATLALGGPFILRLWVGDEVTASTSLLVGLAVWTTLSAVGSAQSIALNGLGVLRIQAFCAIAATALAMVAKVAMVERYGIAGAVWATIPVYVVVVLVPGGLAARHEMIALSKRARPGGTT